MAEQFELTAEMQAMIGWESDPWPYEVTTTGIRAFARGVGYTDPVFYDIEAAKAAGYRNLPAPPTYLGTAVFIPGQNDDNLSIPPGSYPPVPHGLPNILDAGTETEYFESICGGDTLNCVARLANMETKQSKAFGIMLVMSIEFDYTNQNGNIAAVQRCQVIFY